LHSQTREHRHGRHEERTYFVSRVPSDFAPRTEWPWVKGIGTAVRITTHADGTQTDEVRYYILSRFLSATRFAEAVRKHWGIESMHWVLALRALQAETAAELDALLPSVLNRAFAGEL
jgi:predicted transposase YbfD/YdcC